MFIRAPTIGCAQNLSDQSCGGTQTTELALNNFVTTSVNTRLPPREPPKINKHFWYFETSPMMH